MSTLPHKKKAPPPGQGFFKIFSFTNYASRITLFEAHFKTQTLFTIHNL